MYNYVTKFIDTLTARQREQRMRKGLVLLTP
jgi:hypothetical protein